MEAATTEAVLGTVLGTSIGGIVGGLLGRGSPSSPAPPPVPERQDVSEDRVASLSRRRALSRSQRSTLLGGEDTRTPVAGQIAPNQIGRRTLLGG